MTGWISSPDVFEKSRNPDKWSEVRKFFEIFSCDLSSVDDFNNILVVWIRPWGDIVVDDIMIQRTIEYRTFLDSILTAIGAVGGASGVLFTIFGILLPYLQKLSGFASRSKVDHLKQDRP